MKRRRSTIGLLLAAALLMPVYAQAAPPAFRALLLTKTVGARHASIPAAISSIQSLASTEGFEVDATEDSSRLNDSTLANYDVVIFALTSGDILTVPQKGAFERYIRNGGGFVGIHSAAETEKSWTFFTDLVGNQAEASPPPVAAATVKVADRLHPSTSSLPERWVTSDEWYNFKNEVRGQVHVLATVDETSYPGGTDGYDHPVAWCRGFQGGRSWYTAGGHTSGAWSDPAFKSHVLGGIRYAAANLPGDCGAAVDSSFEKVVLDADMNQPMSMDIARDGRVIFIERFGKVKIYKPSANATVVSATLAVSIENDHGLQGIALDPSFSETGWLYLYYTKKGFPEVNRLSRFTLVGDTLDMGSERILLSFTTFPQCCHQGGSIAFDPDGNMYLSTGDEVSPNYSDGYTPIDERPDRVPLDAQGTTANRNSLKGKILRIRPLATTPSTCLPDQQGLGCTYTVPNGNLFPADGSNGRPEAYVMGIRNPFRISIDPETRWLYFGDVGPDANFANANRGPEGYDEVNQVREPGNFGWPYCIANNKAYRDYNFATGLSGDVFNCNAPVNDSPNNTGSQSLPPAKPAFIYYHYGETKEFPEMGRGNRTAEAGPVYHYDPSLASETKFPPYYDDTLFVYDWSRNWIKNVKLDQSGNVLKINDFMGSASFKSPVEMEMGPEGSMYVLEFGTTTDYVNYLGAQLVRIDHVNGKRRPVIETSSTTPTAGVAPLTVNLSAEGSYDPDPEDQISYAWDIDRDGTTDSTSPSLVHEFPAGNHNVLLTVSDNTGKAATANLKITSGNSVPVVTIEDPPDGKIHHMGSDVSYRVRVRDLEDGDTSNGTINCNSVVLTVSQVHDSHGHQLKEYRGCEGTFATSNAGHSGANVSTGISVRYTDLGAPGGIEATTGQAAVILQPSKKQAEYWTSQSGVQNGDAGDALQPGGQAVGFTQDGDWISFPRFNLAGVKGIKFRASSANLGCNIEIRVGSPTGLIIGKAVVPPTGSWNVFVETVTPISDPGGTNELFLVFKRPLPIETSRSSVDKDMALTVLNWFELLL